MTATAEDIIRFLRSEAQHPLKTKELARALDVPEADYVEFKELLGRLVEDGLLYRVKGQRYALPKKINLAVGRLQTSSPVSASRDSTECRMRSWNPAMACRSRTRKMIMLLTGWSASTTACIRNCRRALPLASTSKR